MKSSFTAKTSTLVLLLLITITGIGVVTAISPSERILGANVRIVYLHGAWVWAGLLSFLAAAICGLTGLLLHQDGWDAWSQALGWTGMTFWLTYLPMSLLVMQMNWGGFFFDEPRWKVPFTFAIIGVLLQAGLLFLNSRRVTSASNLIFAAALFISLRATTNILHPDNPIVNSASRSIQVYFAILLALTLVLAAQVANGWHQLTLRERISRRP